MAVKIISSKIELTQIWISKLEMTVRVILSQSPFTANLTIGDRNSHRFTHEVDCVLISVSDHIILAADTPPEKRIDSRHAASKKFFFIVSIILKLCTRC